jgi:ketosteroid isomerase-like protein
MKCNIRILVWSGYAILICACQEARQSDASISKEEMMKIVRKNDDKFSEGIKTKNAEFLANIYSDSAQYVQPNRNILDGKDGIRKDWENFIQRKENPVDLLFHIHDVRGNREIIYETGDGYTQLADSAIWKFNYVNVWRLQKDGSYKLEVDVYNELK